MAAGKEGLHRPEPRLANPDRVAQNTAAADHILTAADLARIATIAPDGGLGGRLA